MEADPTHFRAKQSTLNIEMQGKVRVMKFCLRVFPRLRGLFYD